MIESQTTTTTVNKMTINTRIEESSEKFIHTVPQYERMIVIDSKTLIHLNNEILIAVLISSESIEFNSEYKEQNQEVLR